MKNTILVLGFFFVGFIGFSQQINEESTKIFHKDQKIYERTINDSNIKIIINDINVLVINELEDKKFFENNIHEITHDSFKADENQFDYKEGVYTLNEYVINYKPEFITITTK